MAATPPDTDTADTDPDDGDFTPGRGRMLRGELSQRFANAFNVLDPDDRVRSAVCKLIPRVHSWDDVPPAAREMLRRAEARRPMPEGYPLSGPPA